MALEREKETYRAKRAELEPHQGKFVLIHGDTVVDVFDTYADAIRHGYRQFGAKDPFLVKRIEIPETVQTITRLLNPAIC
ncbi:MAG: hypothetical protein ACREMD_15280 [Gemmatimonadota bacterium]